MASPHVAGVAALIKAIHPDYTPAQVTALLKKQAGELYDHLEAPTDGKEYRGAGLVNAYAAVTEDQPKATVKMQYSTDNGATWKDLDGATIPGAATIRIAATGPITSISYTVDGSTVTKTLGGGMNEQATYDVDVDYSNAKTATAKSVKVSVLGRNQDVTNDDVDVTANYTAGEAYVPPTPQKYTVKFDVNGGSDSVASQSVESGKKASRPVDPTRDGYTFDGWFTAASGGSEYDFSTSVTKDIT
ncbi:InlB B-repeat-containing protein, partial [Bifidobacterium sp. LC6]|nr:InlB B-repeat-containing protein [Bifidobacterium colobi]